MKLILCLSLFLSLISASVFSADKPFRKVYSISSGSTYDTAVLVGALNGLESEMTHEDLIIVTNASALAAVIFYSFPDRESRLEYLQSDDYYAFLKSFKINLFNIPGLVDLLPSTQKRNDEKMNPNLSNLLSLPTAQSLPSPFMLPKIGNKTFAKLYAETRPALMILTTKVNYDPAKKSIEEVDKAEHQAEHGPLFTLYGLTDPITKAKILDSGVEIDVLGHFESNAPTANNELVLESRYDVSTAVRMTLGNPPLFPGVKIDDSLFTGGNLNHDPVDLAMSLAREGNVVSYSGPMGDEEVVLRDVFGYDLNSYRRSYEANPSLGLIRLDTYFKTAPYKRVSMSLNVSNFFSLPPHATYQKRIKTLYDAGEELGNNIQ